MKRLRIVYELSDGSKRSQTFPALDTAQDTDLENIVNQIKNLTTRTVFAAFSVDTTMLNV